MAYKIKKGDTVQVIAGKNRGDQGKVIRILPRKGRALVEGLNLVKKHQKAAQGVEAGINEIEAPIHLSNLMVVDPADNRPCRVGFEVKDGRKYRISKRTGQVLD